MRMPSLAHILRLTLRSLDVWSTVRHAGYTSMRLYHHASGFSSRQQRMLSLHPLPFTYSKAPLLDSVWAIQVQLLLQIICNRIGILMDTPRQRVRTSHFARFGSTHSPFCASEMPQACRRISRPSDQHLRCVACSYVPQGILTIHSIRRLGTLQDGCRRELQKGQRVVG